MSSRNYAIPTITIVVLGSGVWWVLAGRDSRKGTVPTAIPAAVARSDVTGTANPASAALPAPVVDEAGSSQSSDADALGNVSPRSAPVIWSENTLAFQELIDPDPVLSKELESRIGRSLDSQRDRYEVQSITCRGPSCQILSIATASEVESGLQSVLTMMLRELDDASLRNPSTGVNLKPKLQMVMPVRGEGQKKGIITMVSFEAQ